MDKVYCRFCGRPVRLRLVPDEAGGVWQPVDCESQRDGIRCSLLANRVSFWERFFSAVKAQSYMFALRKAVGA